MIESSITAHIINGLFSKVKNSYSVILIMKFIDFLKNEFLSSGLLKVLSSIVSFIKRQYDVSFLKSFVDSKEHIHAFYEKSLLCGLVCFVFSRLSTICGKSYNLINRLSSGGISQRLGSYFANKKLFSYHSVFALMIAFMMVCPHDYWNNLLATIFAFGLGLWFLIRVYNKKETADFSKINFWLVIFVLFAMLISVLSYAKGDALRIMLFVISAVIFALLLAKCLNTKEKMLYLLKIVCTALCITSAYGILQRFMGIEVNPEYVDITSNSDMPGRVFSTFGNPNNFAELLVLFIPLTAALIFVLKSRKQKLFFTACLVLDIVAIGMSYSRSCWVALAISVVVMLLIYDWRLLVPIASVAIAAIPLLPQSIFLRMLSIGSLSDSSNTYRIYIWTGAIRVLKNFFLSGIGAGPENFATYYRPLAELRAITAPHSHMIYMELIIEFGLFSTIGFFGYFISVMKKGLSVSGKTDKTLKAIIAATTGSMAGMLFVCAAEYVWFYPRDMFMFWIVLGIISAATNIAFLQKKKI